MKVGPLIGSEVTDVIQSQPLLYEAAKKLGKNGRSRGSGGKVDLL